MAATLGGEKKSVSRKTSFLHYKEVAPSTAIAGAHQRKQTLKESIAT